MTDGPVPKRGDVSSRDVGTRFTLPHMHYTCAARVNTAKHRFSHMPIPSATPTMPHRNERDVATLHEQLAEQMEQRGLRSTSQRRLVCDVFFRSAGHHSVDDLLALVHKKDPKVGYATVYRTLKLLVECGLANERRFGDALTRFEVTDHERHHDHLICVGCDEIVEFEDREIERLQDELADRHGYILVRHKHELYGLCKSCQTKRRP